MGVLCPIKPYKLVIQTIKEINMKKLKYLILFSILFVPSFALGFTQSSPNLPIEFGQPGTHFPGCSTSDKIGDGGCDIECTNGFIASCRQRDGYWDCWWRGSSEGSARAPMNEGFGSPCTW